MANEPHELPPRPAREREHHPFEAPVLLPGQTYRSVSDHIAAIVLKRPVTPGWLAGLGLASALVALLLASVSYLLYRGVGIWGVNVPVAWGFAIANFVWWIGIGHAGTLISAFLRLMRQRWRTSINRFAEAMTIFAVMCAGLFPLLHLGRPWFFFWLLPYPNTMGLWPQWRSPLVWDVFAVGTYLTVSILFWYMGMVPDLATLRDRATRPLPRLFYGVLALGWRGASAHWARFETGYALLAGIATPLVISVHSIVSFDFTIALLPGWHSTIFPPYFVAGAVFSGFAMVLTLVIPLRRFYRLEAYITAKHLDAMAKLLLATALMVDYGYLMELFMGWYSADRYEWALVVHRVTGPYWFLFWLTLLCNLVVPQALWKASVRRSLPALFAIALVTNFGMWIERVMIVVSTLAQDYLPTRWHIYVPTLWDWTTLFGTIGLFFFLFLLFIRFLPMISISEMRHLVDQTGGGPGGRPAGGPAR